MQIGTCRRTGPDFFSLRPTLHLTYIIPLVPILLLPMRLLITTFRARLSKVGQVIMSTWPVLRRVRLDLVQVVTCELHMGESQHFPCLPFPLFSNSSKQHRSLRRLFANLLFCRLVRLTMRRRLNYLDLICSSMGGHLLFMLNGLIGNNDCAAIAFRVRLIFP